MQQIKNPWLGIEGYNCFGCCPDNPIGLKMRFYEDGEDVVCLWHPQGLKQLGRRLPKRKYWADINY